MLKYTCFLKVQSYTFNAHFLKNKERVIINQSSIFIVWFILHTIEDSGTNFIVPTQCKSSGVWIAVFRFRILDMLGLDIDPYIYRKRRTGPLSMMQARSVWWCALERTLLLYQLLRVKIPTQTIASQNLFSYFNFFRNLKDQFSFSFSRWRAWVRLSVVNAHSLGFNQMCFVDAQSGWNWSL